MKCFRRYCSALCVCLLLLVVFSVPVNASPIEVPNYIIEVNGEYRSVYNSARFPEQGNWSFEPLNYDNYVTYNDYDFIDTKDTYYDCTTNWYIKSIDGKPLVYQGGPFTFSLNDAYYSTLFTNNTNGTMFYERAIGSIRALITYEDNTHNYIEHTDINITQEGPLVDLSFNFTPEKNVTSIQFIITKARSFPANNGGYAISVYYGKQGASKWLISINQQSEEAGLLGGIINKLTSGFNALGDKLTNVFDSIKELPSKIWSFIENGLKALFVPSEEFLVSFRDDMDNMLSEKLGAVYQVIDLTLGSWDRIQANDQHDTVNFPETTINLPEGESFTFGGYDIKIVPDGFEFLVALIKTFVGIVCTLLFVNGLKKIYQDIVEG